MSIVPAYNYTLANLAGYGARRLLSAYSGRGLRGARRPTGVTAMEYDARYEALRRAINRNAPAVENVLSSYSITSAINTTSRNSFNLTSALIGSSDFSLKYIGDKFRLHALKLRCYFDPNLFTVRVIVYTPKNIGEDFAANALGFTTIVDPTVFTVHYDTTMHPASGCQSRKQILIKTINLKKRLCTIDRTGATSGAVKSNEIIVSILTENRTGTAYNSDIAWQMMFSNK